MQAQIHAPRTGYAYNLLDNSDFRNPVNQRGQTTYDTAFGYSIDRWKLGESGTRVQIVSGGIQVGDTGNTPYPYIFQTLERLLAGMYTFAAKFTGNTGFAALTNWFTDTGVVNAPTSTDADGVLCMTFTCDGSLDGTNYLFFRLQQSASAQCVFEWAALYEGEYTADTLPPYQPKGYAVELAECQRYYQVLPETSSCIFSISPQSGRYFSNSFALNPMRASPNVTFVTDDNGNIGIVQGVSLVSASEINIVYNDRVKNGILLLSTTNAAYAGLVMSFNGIQFSADL